MSCGIYKITNLINGHSYIGQSICIEIRWKNHKCYDKECKDYPLYRAFRKYGIENFSFEIIEECEPNLLNEKEIYWINFYNTYLNGYNQTSGGDRRNNSFVKLTDDDIKTIYDLLINSNITQKQIAQEFKVDEKTISEINNGRTRIQSGYTYPLRKNRKDKNFCIDCGKEILSTSTRCESCYKKTLRKVERPQRDELKQLIRSTPFLQIGKKYNVSDNTIRKWCMAENLPIKKREINSYSDEEWELI